MGQSLKKNTKNNNLHIKSIIKLQTIWQKELSTVGTIDTTHHKPHHLSLKVSRQMF